MIENGFRGKSSRPGDLPYRRAWLIFTKDKREYTADEVKAAARDYMKKTSPHEFNAIQEKVEELEAKALKDIEAPGLNEEAKTKIRNKAEEEKAKLWASLINTRLKEMEEQLLNDNFLTIQPLEAAKK